MTHLGNSQWIIIIIIIIIIIMMMMMMVMMMMTTTTTMMMIIIIILLIIMMILMMMMMMIIIVIIIIVIIIIALKGAIRDFLQSPHCAANRLQHVRSSGPGAIVCKSRATRRVTCHVVRRDSSAIKYDRVEIAFI